MLVTSICQGCSVPLLLLIYPMSHSQQNFCNFLFKIITKGCKNDKKGRDYLPPVYTTCRKSYKKKERNK